MLFLCKLIEGIIVLGEQERWLPFLFTLFLLKSPLIFLCLPNQLPHCLPFHIFMQHPGNRLFAVKHQKRAVLFAVNLLCPVFRTQILHGSGNHTFMNRRTFQQATLGMAAVVDAFFLSGKLRFARYLTGNRKFSLPTY